MSPVSAEIVTAYVGPNSSHRTFRAGLANAKVLAFILGHKEQGPLKEFLEQTAEVKAKAQGGPFAMGLGGRATSSTIQLGVHLTSNEIEIVAGAPGGFTAQGFGLVYREVYRVFESYLADLYEEIGVRQPRILYSSKTLTHEEALRANEARGVHGYILEARKSELTRLGFLGIERTFKDIGLALLSPEPLTLEHQGVRARLLLLSAVRNVIEHNQSIVNDDFVRLIPESRWSIGERIVISSVEMGDALSAVEFTADGLNRRALEKFSLV